jgi:ribosome-associated heat shock protein Hsp15
VSQRVDKWLWFARFFKTRSLAARLVETGGVRLNRVPLEKPSQLVKAGDVLTFPQGRAIRVIQVIAIGERRGPPAEARTLYEDLEPAPPRPDGPPAS